MSDAHAAAGLRTGVVPALLRRVGGEANGGVVSDAHAAAGLRTGVVPALLRRVGGVGGGPGSVAPAENQEAQ
ncbi:hypothetical protein [Streptomyces sp. NPDC059176]|uniref:hypothetical protein n=1 Tax=unclassified Streptomyces TaxID=2593676 RepID=UPI00369292EF